MIPNNDFNTFNSIYLKFKKNQSIPADVSASLICRQPSKGSIHTFDGINCGKFIEYICGPCRIQKYLTKIFDYSGGGEIIGGNVGTVL